MQRERSATAGHEKTSIATLQNYINGKWVASAGEVLPNINPANIEEILCYVPLSTREETRLAVAAAKEAFPKWRATPPPQRGKLLFKAMQLLQERLEEVSTLLTREEGKILRDSRGEVQRSINIMEFTAEKGGDYAAPPSHQNCQIPLFTLSGSR